jgi:hypothetical protein
MLDVKIHLPNSAHLQNLQGFLNRCEQDDAATLDFSMDTRWVSVHPAVLAMTACAAAMVKNAGGKIGGKAEKIGSLPYLIRMGLFAFLGIEPGQVIAAHEAAGRFIPITQIRTARELQTAIVDLVPLLHTAPREADPIKYVFSELVRNVLEHAQSPVGAFMCAQYYAATRRISIGIADGGIGILGSMSKYHQVATAREAISLALQPGITGTTARSGGTAENAGAGLFFTKSIAAFSRNFFVLYSGDAMFKLLKGSQKRPVVLRADPTQDNHVFAPAPTWRGTVAGIDISMSPGQQFGTLLRAINKIYTIDVRRKKKAYYKGIHFV